MVRHGIQILQIEDRTILVNNTPYTIHYRPLLSDHALAADDQVIWMLFPATGREWRFLWIRLWLNELRILANVKMWNTAMQIQYLFSMFQTRQGQFIIHHNTWPRPQLLALTQSFISQCYFLAYGPASCLSCLPAQVPEASNIHFIPHAHCKRSVSTPAHIPWDVASRFPSDHVPNLPPAPSLPLPFSPCGNGTS